MYNAPEYFGVAVTDIACLNFWADTETGAICEDPDEHLYWDRIHPTTAVHSEMGEMAHEPFDNYHDEVD